MNLSEEIQRLHRLQQSGALTEAEFATAKAKLLNIDEPQPVRLTDETDTRPMEAQLDEIRLQNELERLDREWNLERENYMIRGRYGTVSPPSQTASVVGAAIMGGFGLIWTLSAASMGAPGVFPLFGVMFIAIGVGSCINAYIKANQYQEAQRRYEERRASLLARNKRRFL